MIPEQAESAKGLVFDIEPASRPLAYTGTAEFLSLGMYGQSEDISGGMGLEGALEFRKFVEDGGVLVTLGSGGRSGEAHRGDGEHPEYACIGGLYFTKGYGGVAQIWGDPKDPVVNFRPQVPLGGDAIEECVGTGMGFNLWRLSMFKDERLARPWFRTEKKNGVGTQDLVFWNDARKYGYRCAVHNGVRVGHYDSKGDFGPGDFTW